MRAPRSAAIEASATFTARRKQIYEALHPETRHGVVGNGREKSRQFGDSTSERFTADTAAKTGQSERVVQRDAARGEKVSDDVLAAIKGTSLDRGSNLDKLAALPREQQIGAIEAMRVKPAPAQCAHPE